MKLGLYFSGFIAEQLKFEYHFLISSRNLAVKPLCVGDQ